MEVWLWGLGLNLHTQQIHHLLDNFLPEKIVTAQKQKIFPKICVFYIFLKKVCPLHIPYYFKIIIWVSGLKGTRDLISSNRMSHVL